MYQHFQSFNVGASSFEEYVRMHRFREADHSRQIEALFKICKKLRKPRLLIVHSPYPVEEPEGISKGEREDEYLLSGRGVGKTDLLASLEARYGEMKDCRVFAFLDNRERVGSDINFYREIFLERLAQVDVSLFESPRWLTFRAWRDRLALLVYVSVPVLVGALAWWLGLLGFEGLRYIVDPKNQPVIARIVQTVVLYRSWLTLVGIGLVILWLLYAWGALIGKKDLKARWDELDPKRQREEWIARRKEQLTRNPEEILDRFASDKTLLLIIDDIDELDNRTLDTLLDLYDAAKELNRPLLLVLSYNPRNPTLGQPHKLRIRDELSMSRIDERDDWFTIGLVYLSRDDVVDMLWDYWRDERAEQLLQLFERRFPEAARRTGLILGFFSGFEKALLKKEDLARC